MRCVDEDRSRMKDLRRDFPRSRMRVTYNEEVSS
jgi:hypothetical protein